MQKRKVQGYTASSTLRLPVANNLYEKKKQTNKQKTKTKKKQENYH